MPTRSRLRRFAAYVLLAWLLGLASGIANACLVGEIRHDQSVHIDHDMATLGHAGHERHGGQSDHDKPPCERLCDAPAARPADKEFTSALAGFWLAPAPLPLVTLRLLPARAQAIAMADPPSRVTVPLPIAFGRLTL